MDWTYLAFTPVILLLLFFIFVLYQRKKEKKSYNNGICPKCGGLIRSQASYSSGTLYGCNECAYKMVLDYYENPPSAKYSDVRTYKLRKLTQRINGSIR